MDDDDDGFDFDFPDENASPEKKKNEANVNEDDDRESLRHGLRQFSQRSQGGAPPPEDEGEEIECRSDFERALKEDHGVGLRRDEEGKEYFYLSHHMNHLAFVNHLNAVLSNGKADKLMEEFGVSIDGRLILFLYFAPMKSRAGEQDTLWKALLLCRHTQNRAFDLLMEEMQKLGKDGSAESRSLSLVAVAHIRYLDCVFNSKILFDFIFDRDFHKWKPCVRDELIQSIPEILGDVVSQNDAAMNLLSLITEITVEEEQNDFRIAIINSLKLLTTGREEASQIRSKLIKMMNSMEARAAIEVVNCVMDGLDTNDLPTLHQVLTHFSLHFKLNFQPTLGTKNKKTKDDVAIGVGAKIGRFVQLSGSKCWKEMGAFLRSLSSDGERNENGEDDNQTIRKWRIFDVILCISLLSIEGCSPSVGSALKAQITDESREEGVLEGQFNTIFEMSKFCLAHFSSLLRLSRSLLWSPLDELNHFSSFLYSSLLRSAEKKRKETLSSMLSHIDKSEREAAVVLECISHIIKKEYNIIKEHVKTIHRSFLSLLPSLSLATARLMLNVVISICIKDSTQEALKIDLEETSRRLLSSLSSPDQLLGIVCMVMQLQSSLEDQNGLNREERIHILLDSLGAATKGSSILRWTLYDEIRLMVERSRKWKISDNFMKWAETLEETFKEEFFSERIDSHTHAQTLEADKYVNESSKQWLQVTHERLVELVPLFGLLKELSVVKCGWKNDEDSQEALNSSFKQFAYTFEANISMCGATSIWSVEKDELLVNSTIFFHLINWIRTLLNSFCEREEGEDSPLSKLKSMKFSLLFDMEKALVHTIKQLGEVRVPSSIVRDITLVVYDESVKKPSKKRPATSRKEKKGRNKKKKGEEEEEVGERRGEDEGEREEDIGVDEDDKSGIIEEKVKRLALSSLHSIFLPFKMSTVVQLLKLQVRKRNRSIYLLDNLLSIMKVVLPKKEKKAVPWSTRRSPLDGPSIEYHGNASCIWKWTLSSISPLMQMLVTSSHYSKERHDEEIGEHSMDDVDASANMLNKSLSLLTEIFTWKEIVTTSGDESEKRANKRRILMETVEKNIMDHANSQRESESEDAEAAVLRFLLRVAESVPTIECAVSVMECCYSIEGRDEDTDKRLGLLCLEYLNKEWRSVDGKTHKGTAFKNSVRRLVELYLCYRTLNERSNAILWLLAEQLAALVGDSDRRKSKMDTVLSPVDDFVPQNLNGQKFATINKETFPVVYKTLFTILNSTLNTLLSTTTDSSSDDLLTVWSKSGSSFMLLCLFIRVSSLRSNGVLVTAAKEGRRFLSMFTKPNGFMSFLEDETAFSLITTQAISIIKSVQTGNRTLQSITVHAKTNRNEALLKMIPDLRASGEGLLRSIYSALTFLGCEAAFDIGLLKGRDIDGEEIIDERREDTPEDGEEEGEEEGVGVGEEDETGSSLEKTVVKDEMEREGSPVY